MDSMRFIVIPSVSSQTLLNLGHLTILSNDPVTLFSFLAFFPIRYEFYLIVSNVTS